MRRFRPKTRAYEWNGAKVQGTVNDASLAFEELGGANGIYPSPTAGSVNPDIKLHRLLFNIDFYLADPIGGNPIDTVGTGTQFTLGLLETEFDNTNSALVVYDPQYDNGNQDAEWLWIWAWNTEDNYAREVLGNSAGKLMTFSELKPNLRYEFDIKVRQRGAGASVNMKRRDLCWVFSSDLPAATGQVVFTLNYRGLLSVPK